MGLKEFFIKRKQIAELKKKTKALYAMKKKEKEIDALNYKANKAKEEMNKMLKIKDGKFIQAEAPPIAPQMPQQQYVPQQQSAMQYVPQQQEMPQQPQYAPQPQFVPQQQEAPQGYAMPPQQFVPPQEAFAPQERQFQQQMPQQQPEMLEVAIRLVDGSELSVAVDSFSVVNLINELSAAMAKKDIVKLNTIYLSGDKIIFFKLI